MKKILSGICLIFLFFSCSASKEDANVVSGVYDISELAANEIAELQGKWIFIANDFVDPNTDFSKYTRYEDINQPWVEYNPPMNLFAYATYAIKIKNLSPSGVYALKIPNISSACTMYLNGKEIYKSGQIGQSAKDELFNWESAFIIIPTEQLTEVMLVLHISNFNDKTPVNSSPIKIGFYNALVNSDKQDILHEVISAGLLLVIGIFFLSLFIFYSESNKAFYFGLICIVFSIRICAYDEFLLKVIFPSMSGYLLFKIGYLTLSAEIILCTLFLNEFFVKLDKKKVFLILIPAFIYSLINIFCPIRVSGQLLLYAQIYLLIMAVYNLAIVTTGLLKKNKDAYLFIVGLIVFIIVSIIDILISNRIIEGNFVAHIGIFALLIPMAIIVLRNFKSASDKLMTVSTEVERTNETLTKFVPNEFMQFLNKRHMDVDLGDNVLKDMYIAFIHLGISANLEKHEDRLKFLEIYNKTLGDIHPLIKKHDGFIDKYLTEGLMVLFHGSANDVVECMIEIKEYIDNKNKERKEDGLELIELACGVHYGKTMLGTIGETNRMDSTVISDVVNVASRLHFYAIKQNVNIFISEAVKEQINESSEKEYKKNVNYKYSGLVKFRGKEEPIPIYEVQSDDK